MPRKILKLSHDHDSVCDSPPNSNNCTNLPHSCLLYLFPAEILEKIFSYLNPRDLLSIRELDFQRFTEISLTVKHAHFSQCNTVRTLDMSAFFTKDRVQHIQEINFNNIFFVQNSILEKFILKCKHLKRLFVYESGLTYTNIVSIIAGCQELEELYWSIMEKTEVRLSKKPAVATKLKKLYLNVRKNVSESFFVVIDILNRCIGTFEICLNMSPCFTTSLPPSMDRKVFVGKLNLELGIETSCPVSRFFRHELQQYATPAVAALKELLAVHTFVINIANVPVDPSSLFTSHAPILQVLTEVDVLNAIPSLPPNSIHALVLIVTDTKQCLDSHIEMLKQVTGPKLKHFAVHYFPHDKQISKLVPNMQCDFITEITSTCLNIQALNLSDLHFQEPFCFKSLYHLTRLKVLSLSACILKSPFTLGQSHSLESTNLQTRQMFEGFVAQCRNIQIFSFYGCLQCNSGPTDEEFIPISKLPKLTHLLISRVPTFRLCHFLSRVADSCPALISLEIVEVGLAVCHFIPSVLHILRKSQQLIFLRINQKAFNPMDSLFWKTVELAQNLQGLCLSFDLATVVENKMIINALKQMPFLHLFHLCGQRVAENLSRHVNLLMSKNGVEKKRIEVSIRRYANGNPIECMVPHFPI